MSLFLRVAVSGTADMDETEQLVFTQALRPGYGAQLPLYTWLQYLSFTLFGVNIFALSLLKYTLLFGTYACVLEVARRTLRDVRGAVAATLSLFLIPQVVWESYRTLTNTVLATFVAALTLLLFLRLQDKPTPWNYVLVGAAAGLGMLTKYNFALFLLALLIAGLMTADFRATLMNRRSVLTLLAALVTAVPPYAWIAANLEKATASTGKLQTLGGSTLMSDYLYGFGSLLASTIGYFWPALLVLPWFLLSPRTRETATDRPALLLLLRTLLASLSLCALLVLCFRVTYFKERWLQPLLFFLPILFMGPLGTRWDGRRFRRLLVLTLTPALLAMAAFPGGVLLASRTGKETRLSPPYRSLAETIRKDGFPGGTIVTDDHRIGGNFRFVFKDSAIVVPGMLERQALEGQPVLAVWNADRKPLPPEDLTRYLEEHLGTITDPTRFRYAEKPMLYWKEKTMKLGYVIIAAR